MILVAGAGLAGSVTALALARRGVPVTLLERQTTHGRKVCGEFVSAEAVARLVTLGIDVFALGAVPIDRVTLAATRREATAHLPFRAASLGRGVLDGAVLAAATAAGATLRRGADVKRVSARADGAVATLADGEAQGARLVAAFGKRPFADLPRRPARAALGDIVAFRQTMRLTGEAAERLAGTVEIHLFRCGYLGLQPSGAGTANLCLTVRTARLAEVGGRLAPLLDAIATANAPFAARLAGMTPVGTADAIARVPYGFRHRAARGEAIVRVGDQFAVTPSFTGDGMAIAVASGALAANGIVAGHPADAIHRAIAAAVGPQMRAALAASHLVSAAPLHDLSARAARLWPGGLTRAAALTRLAEPVHPVTCPSHA